MVSDSYLLSQCSSRVVVARGLRGKEIAITVTTADDSRTRRVLASPGTVAGEYHGNYSITGDYDALFSKRSGLKDRVLAVQKSEEASEEGGRRKEIGKAVGKDRRDFVFRLQLRQAVIHRMRSDRDIEEDRTERRSADCFWVQDR